MKTLNLKKKLNSGFALGEMLLAVAIVAVLVGIGAVVYGNLRGGINADDQAAKTISLVSDIQKNYRNAGTFGTLTAAEINKLLLLQKPLKFDGTNVVDAYGNVMVVSGGTTSFVLTIGGTTNPVSNADCAAIANRLGAGVATNINIGTAATAGTGATAGQVTGGNVFKAGSVITQTNLTTGCNEANPVIASMFR